MGRRATAVRIATVTLATALVAALTACQTGPPPPLLSPLEQARRFGYTERDVGPDRVEVGYLEPRRRVAGFAPWPRDSDVQPAREQAFDLATWRVAELALARGKAGFRIVDRKVEVDVQRDPF